MTDSFKNFARSLTSPPRMPGRSSRAMPTICRGSPGRSMSAGRATWPCAWSGATSSRSPTSRRARSCRCGSPGSWQRAPPPAPSWGSGDWTCPSGPGSSRLCAARAERVRRPGPAPVIAGQGKIGMAVAVDPGDWSGRPAPTLALQWSLDGADLPGATGPWFTPTPDHDRGALSCRVLAGNAAGSAAAESFPLIVRYAPPFARAAGRHIHSGYRSADFGRILRLHRRRPDLQRHGHGRQHGSRHRHAPRRDRRAARWRGGHRFRHQFGWQPQRASA